MEEKTEQETVQETTCSGHEHEHDKPRYGRQNTESCSVCIYFRQEFHMKPYQPKLSLYLDICILRIL